MSKKGKLKRHLRPPLTFLDKSIYFSCIVISFLLSLLLTFCFDDILNLIAFSNNNAIAYRSNASMLFALPFLLYLEISVAITIIVAWEEKKPIFGSKSIKYGEYPFDEDCIPLFSKKKRKQITPAKKLFRRKIIITWCLVLLVFASLIPLSLFGRDVMYKNNSIEKINLVNATVEAYSTDDFSTLTIRTKYVSGKGANYWKYEISIKMIDEKEFTFSNRDFDWRVSDSKDICLDKMLEIKALFSTNQITIEGANDITRVADFLGLNEQQLTKLNTLFSQ